MTALNAADAAWLLTATCLVLMMTAPGLVLFYGGMVRRGNVLFSMMQSLSAMCCCVTACPIPAIAACCRWPKPAASSGTSFPSPN